MDNNLKNLINLSSEYDIKLFNKKMSIKSKDILVKEFEKKKNKELKNSSYILSNLSKISNNNIEDIKYVYKNLEEKINNINNIINYVSNMSNNKIEINTIEINNNYIESYSN